MTSSDAKSGTSSSREASAIASEGREEIVKLWSSCARCSSA